MYDERAVEANSAWRIPNANGYYPVWRGPGCMLDYYAADDEVRVINLQNYAYITRQVWAEVLLRIDGIKQHLVEGTPL